MSYNWSIKELHNILNQLEELKARAIYLNDPSVSSIMGEIENITDVIDCYHNIKEDDEDDIYIDRNHFITRDNYNDLLEIPDNIRQDVEKSFLTLKDLYDTYDEISLPKYMTNSKDLVDLVNDFVNWLPTKNKLWKDSFTKFTDPKNHLLKFRKYDDGYSGITYFNYYPSYIPHFLVKRRYNISDFITLIHELAHGTIGIYGKSKVIYSSEIEGWYFQFLGREFLNEKKIVSPMQVKQLEYNDFSVIFDYYIAIILYNACKSLKDSKKGLTVDKIKKLSSTFFNYLALDQQLLKTYLEISPIEDYTYLYSYLLSLDLEEKFKDDRELSFYNFNNMAICSEVDHNSLRDNGITFMDDDYKSFKKKIETINTY